MVATAALSSTGCKSSSDQGKGTTEYTRTAGGATSTTTYATTATVTGIDAPNRKVTLTQRDGTTETYKCGPEVRNFNQIRIGDQVKTTLTEQVAMFLRKAGTPASASSSTSVTRAPVGGTPGMAMSDTSEVTGKIIAIDGRHVTLRFADGTIHKIKVSDDADLSGIGPGDAVTAQVTQAMAITVEKP
jgi:Cu/Ag efflux protein CusF